MLAMVGILVNQGCKKKEDDTTNLAPTAPSTPSPANGDTGVAPSALTWAACTDPDNDPVKYDVYYGTSATPGLVQSDLTTNSYSLPSFVSNTVFYWKVIAKDDQGNSSAGPVWTYRTAIATVCNEETVDNTAMALSIYTDVMQDVCSKSDSAHGSKSCPSVSLTPLIGYPKTLTIDFGTSGCSYHGKTVKGIISAQLTGAIRSDGTSVTVTFQNFQIDTIAVSGTIFMSVTDVTLQGTTVTMTDSIINGTLTMPSGTISLSCNMTTVWSLKGTPINYTDDEFTISGCSASGTNREGKTFDFTVTEDLLIKASCQEIVDGKITLNTSMVPYPATIDFGDGACDGLATVSTKIIKQVGSQTFEQDITYTIHLP